MVSDLQSLARNHLGNRAHTMAGCRVSTHPSLHLPSPYASVKWPTVLQCSMSCTTKSYNTWVWVIKNDNKDSNTLFIHCVKPGWLLYTYIPTKFNFEKTAVEVSLLFCCKVILSFKKCNIEMTFYIFRIFLWINWKIMVKKYISQCFRLHG